MSKECKDIVVVDVDNNSDVENGEDKNEYIVFDYFKDHPSLLVAVLPMFFALVSVILKFCGFLAIKSYVSYFGIEEQVPKTTQNFIYLFAIAIVYFIVIIMFQGFINKTFETYLPYKKLFLFYRYYLRNAKTKQKRDKKKLKSAKKKLNKLNNPPEYQKEIKGIEEDMEFIEEQMERTSFEIKSLSKKLLYVRFLFWIIIGLSCLLAGLVLCAAFYTLLSLSGLSEKYLLTHSGVTIGLCVLVCSVFNWIVIECKIKRKEIKKEVELDEETSSDLDLPSMPIVNILRGNLKQWFSDVNCKRVLAIAFVCLFFILFSSSLGGVETAEQKTDFFVVNSDNETYAVIYIDDDMLILEKAIVSGNHIVIDTTCRKVIDSKGISMQKYSFEDVKLKKVN